MKNPTCFIVLLLLTFVLPASGQDKLNTVLHGFVKSDVWFDSRKIVGAREELLLLIPERVKTDSLGNDLNARPGLGFSAITSRINIKSSGVKAFGADAEGFIEADFSGVSNADINTFRLRHAYLNLRWEKCNLLFGQYWHPSFTPEVFPTLVSLNTGAPFQPFIRNPLIQFGTTEGKIRMLAAVVGQRDYSNDGPAGRVPDYFRYAMFPNLHFQLKYQGQRGIVGIAADYKELYPESLNNSTMIQGKARSWSFFGFAQYKRDKFVASAKVIYGQNLSEHLMLGGYALAGIDTANNTRSYTPSQHMFFWGNLVYRAGEFRTGLFGAYARNLGTLEPNLGIFHGRGYDIGAMYRGSGFISLSRGPVGFTAELEYTRAYYGTPDYQGKVGDQHGVGNFRVLFTGSYYF